MKMIHSNPSPAPAMPRFQQEYIPADLKIVIRLQDLIEKEFKFNRKQEFYCNALGVTPARLNALTKFYQNKTIYEMVNERLHCEAVNLLKYSTMSAKEIAFELGICDLSYFIRSFKRFSGLSPQKFRTINRRNFSLMQEEIIGPNS